MTRDKGKNGFMVISLKYFAFEDSLKADAGHS